MSANDNSAIIASFSSWDYLVFTAMLAFSAGIGLYFGLFDRKKGTKEFLMAGKSMGAFPIAMSLLASFMSPIGMLGVPTEIYQNGLIYIISGFAKIIAILSASYLYLPVFWNLQVTSAYHYLEKRFNRGVRIIGALLFMIQMFLYMAIVVYAPALALSQVTRINIYLSVCSICFVCTFYTTLGGMKAVLWTDALQLGVMFTSLMFVVLKGVVDEGGIHRIWEVSTRGNRTNLSNWDFDPRTRHSMFSLIFGAYFIWISIYGANQAQVQRYLCVGKKSVAIKALMFNIIGVISFLCIICLGGLVLYVKYVDCDPVSSGLVEKKDQILPLFVMETLGHLKGMPGLFVAGILAAALSTVSSGINSLAAITLEDFVKSKWPNISERRATVLSKTLSLLYGIITFLLVFVAELLGDILSATLAIFGMIGGPLVGVFTLGMFFPWANSKGALVGTITALALTLWVGIGAQVAIYRKEIMRVKLPVNTCDLVIINETYRIENSRLLEDPYFATPQVQSDDPTLEIYKLSYLLYSALGCLTTLFVGMVVSALTGFQNLRILNPNLLSPAVSWCKYIIPGYNLIGIDLQEKEDINMIKKISQGEHPPPNDDSHLRNDSHIERTKL